MSTRDERLAKLRDLFGVPHVDDMADDDPNKATGTRVGDRVTAIVGYLSVYFPNEAINALLTQAWHLIGSCTTPVALGPVRTVSTALSRRSGQETMLIMVPADWDVRAAEDHTMAVGAMVFCASQAVDFYNGRLLNNVKEASVRARAYEAEVLKVFRDTDPTWVPNSYQAGVLAAFPEGLRTEGVVLYDPKPTPQSANPPVFMGEA